MDPARLATKCLVWLKSMDSVFLSPSLQLALPCLSLPTVTMEETSTFEPTALVVSPDGKVVFFLDQGLGQLTRVEPATGNCRSLGRELSCNII